MKKLLLTAAAALLATLNTQAQSQGSVNFSDAGAPANKRVYVTQTAGQDPMTGTAANSAYSIAFFWSAPGANDWTQIGTSVNFLDGAGAGQFLGGTRTINYPSTIGGNGAVLDIQAKAWSRADGTSYDQVIAGSSGFAGVSPIVNLKTRDPLNTTEFVPALHQDTEWVAWALTPVPEPSVIGLGLLGAGALLMLRRRK